MRLDRVELLNWDIQGHQVLPFAHGVTLITGENGSGKTSILDAIKVCLGATNLGDDRKIGDYVLKQARPVAMVRLLVDNRADPESRRRPFDPLASLSKDEVTLAVVFRAIEEREYARFYYLLDGDVVPLEERTFRRGDVDQYKPLPNLSEYRARLKKVGIGPHYLKLLCLPQGQVARLCKYEDSELFEKLFDIIGGRQALEEWERQITDLNKLRLEQSEVQKDMTAARKDLKQLEAKVRRHDSFLTHWAKLEVIQKAMPHMALKEVRERCEQSSARLNDNRNEVQNISQAREVAKQSAERFRKILDKLEQENSNLRADQEKIAKSWKLCLTDQAACEARFNELDKIRALASGVKPIDPNTIEQEAEEARAAIAMGQANQQIRDNKQTEIDAEIERIDQGLIPFPPEVDAFREKLRTAGIPHHILAEVLEVSDKKWAEAVEGYLGRYRFSVLVQDPDMWPKASELGREFGYPHGVLAPDIRGSSPKDEETLAAILDIKEPRYRPLLARLLRPVSPKEPPKPLAPTTRGVLLAQDGFVISRLESRVAQDNRFFLGRRARKIRKTQLITERAELQKQKDEWIQKEALLRKKIDQLNTELAAQKRRVAWEAVQQEHSSTREQVASLKEQVLRLDEKLLAIRSELDVVTHKTGDARADKRAAETEVMSLSERIKNLLEEQERARITKTEADEYLGQLLAEKPPDMDDETRALLEEVRSVDTLHAMDKQTCGILGEFTEDEKDSGLPRNYRRQQAEVDAVAKRFEQLAKNLEATHVAAEEAKDQYQQTTRRVFRLYFSELAIAAKELDFEVEGRLESLESGRFRCDIRVKVGEKTSVHYSSEQLSGGQKAALSILMGMTAVSLESDAARFFLIDEPFAASDVIKINELGLFLKRTGAQYLVSMPTSAELEQCRDWLQAVWTCTRSRGGYNKNGVPILAPPLKLGFSKGARDV